MSAQRYVHIIRAVHETICHGTKWSMVRIDHGVNSLRESWVHRANTYGRIVYGLVVHGGNLSTGQVVHEANSQWGELSTGRNSPWDEMSLGELSMGPIFHIKLSMGRIIYGTSCHRTRCGAIGQGIIGRVVLGQVVED